MPLKVIVDKLDDVEEAVRDLYVERGGRYELSVEIPGVEGVKSFTDFSKLNDALRKERNDHKVTREKFAPLGDRKVDDVLSQLDRIAELEAAASGKLDETQLNTLVETRLRTKLAPLERERDTLRGEVTKRDELLQGYAARDRQRSVHDSVRKAAGVSKLLDTALEDALLLAERVFDVDEDGVVTAKDGVGCTPGITPEAWLVEMQNKRPHWWGATQGGGANGNRGGGGGVGPNPWAAETWNMTEQAAIYNQSPDRANRLAAAAGTTVGGARPARRA